MQIIHEAEAYVSLHGQRTLPDSMTPDGCNQLVDNLILVTHMVSINESISLGNALLTLGMSETFLRVCVYVGQSSCHYVVVGRKTPDAWQQHLFF